MHKPTNVAELTDLGRVRLSDNFFMRDMLYSEVANLYGIPNIPEDPDLAIQAGEKLCQLVLEPLRKGLGQIAVRSAYRSPAVNGFCNERFKAGDTACFCSDNDFNAARHIWDRRDKDGFLGATASIVVPGYIPYFERTGDWRALGWWIRDHVADYAEVYFYPWLCAFNIRWYEGPSDKSVRHYDTKVRTMLTKIGEPDFDGDHSAAYRNVIPWPST